MKESGHTHPYYRQVLEQEQSDNPPACSYVYYSTTDNWGVEESSPEDIIRGIFRKVDRKVEKKASQKRTNIILSISKAFQETRYIEEAAANKDHKRKASTVLQKAKDQMK